MFTALSKYFRFYVLIRKQQNVNKMKVKTED